MYSYEHTYIVSTHIVKEKQGRQPAHQQAAPQSTPTLLPAIAAGVGGSLAVAFAVLKKMKIPPCELGPGH